MTRPRVLHVYKDVYPPVDGGIERAIYHLARLTQNACEPAVLTAAPGLRGGRRRIPGDVEVTEVATFARVLSTPIAPGFISALRHARADLLHFHFPHPTGEMAYLLSGTRTPAVVTYHSDVVRQQRALQLYRPWMNRFLSRMEVIMPTTRRYMETSEILQPFLARCRPVALGLPPEDYADSKSIHAHSAEFRRRFGAFVFFIGVLRYYKGLAYLLEAMRELPGVPLILAGHGPELENLRALALKLDVGDRVHFLGHVDHETAVALFRTASVFCLPACERSEAFGLCQVEAMLCGLPVVSTDLPTGVPEVNRDGETGIIVPPRDPAALARAIGQILHDDSLRHRLGEGGRKRAEAHFTARRMAAEVSQVYADVLERRAKAQ